MKKLFQILTAAGVVILLYSALALDSDRITLNTIYHNLIIAGVLSAPQIIYNYIEKDDIS